MESGEFLVLIKLRGKPKNKSIAMISCFTIIHCVLIDRCSALLMISGWTGGWSLIDVFFIIKLLFKMFNLTVFFYLQIIPLHHTFPLPSAPAITIDHRMQRLHV